MCHEELKPPIASFDVVMNIWMIIWLRMVRTPLHFIHDRQDEFHEDFLQFRERHLCDVSSLLNEYPDIL